MGGSRDAAEDAFQEALLVILDKILTPGYKLNGSFPGFLFTTAKFKFLNEDKKKGNKWITLEEITTLTKESEAEEPEILALLIETTKKELFDKKLNELGEKCREIMRLFFAGCGYKVIKERLGFPTENTAKQAKFRCQKILKQKMKSAPIYKELYHGK